MQVLLDTGIDNASIKLPKADTKSIRVSNSIKELKDATLAELRAGGHHASVRQLSIKPHEPSY